MYYNLVVFSINKTLMSKVNEILKNILAGKSYSKIAFQSVLSFLKIMGNSKKKKKKSKKIRILLIINSEILNNEF